jgi:hypothetical protein
MRVALLVLALISQAPALAQQPEPSIPLFPSVSGAEPVKVGKNNFALPVIDYRAADGRWKRSTGIIIGREVAPNATIGLGFFNTKPKYQESFTPLSGKSRKVALGFSLRF